MIIKGPKNNDKTMLLPRFVQSNFPRKIGHFAPVCRLYPIFTAITYKKILIFCMRTYQSLDKSSPLLSHFDQITVNVEYAVFLGQLDVGINGQVDSRTTGSITITKKYKTMTMMRTHFINWIPKGPFRQMKNSSYENCFL